MTNTICKKRQGFSLQFTQCKQEAANSLLELKPWHYLSIRLSYLQTSQSTETVMLSKIVMWPVQPIIGWWQNNSRSVYFASWGKIDTACFTITINFFIIVTCVINYVFAYMTWRQRCTVMPFSCSLSQWHMQKIFMGGHFHSVAYGGYLYLVCAVCDVTIWRHIYVSKPKFWRSLLTQATQCAHSSTRTFPLFYVLLHWTWTISAPM